MRRKGVLAATAAVLMAGAQAQAPAQTPTPTPAPAPAPAPLTAVVAVEMDAPAEPDLGRLEPTGADSSDQSLITWQLGIDAPDDLRALLERYLDLARFQRADLAGGPTGSSASEGITRAELARLLTAAPLQARQLLETEGYFDAQVSATIEGSSAAPGQPVRVRVTARPGALARVEQVQIEVGGELAALAESTDPTRSTERERALTLIDNLRLRWPLRTGLPYTQDAWGDAKAATLATLRAEGYAQAGWSGTVANVDIKTPQVHQARLYVVADSGPLFRFGALRFEGLDHVRPAALEALLTFDEGESLREKPLLDYQDRLVKSGLFDAVAVEFDPDPAHAAATPITVRVTERSLQQATFGIGMSDATGPRVTIEHLHQRPLDFDWQAKTKLQLGKQQKVAQVDLTSHPLPGPHRNLIGVALSSTEASGLNVTSERVRLGRTQDGERIERLYYFEWQRAFTRSLTDGGSVDDTSSLTYNYQWVWRDLDHPILPTRGVSLSAEAGVGRSYASTAPVGWFGRSLARVTTYWTPGANWYGQARLQLGEVYSDSQVAVPFTLLFRSGGDDTVRGYGYQSLGPTAADGTSVGGRVMANASLELARPFSSSLPAWWGAVFVDAGNAATRWEDYRPAYGYGVGVRWRSPVGPLRIDLAYGQATQKFRLHLNVGITF